MTNNKNLITKSVSKPAKDLFIDIAEMGLDELTGKLAKDSEFLKQLPIIKWLFIGNNIRSTIQSAFFIKKYASFIGQIATDESLDKEKLLTIFSDNKVYTEVIDNTILYLDRYHNELKAKLLGELFVQTFKENKFKRKEYNSLMFSIEQIHPFDGVEKLKQFYDYRLETESNLDEEARRDAWAKGSKIDYQPLSTTGLLILPNGGVQAGDLGGAYLNDIGKRFYEAVVINCKFTD